MENKSRNYSGDKKPLNNKRPATGNTVSTNKSYSYDNKTRQNNKKKQYKKTESTYRDYKKEILSLVDCDTIEDDMKIYSLSNILLGTQIEELTKVLKTMVGNLKE